MAYDNTSAERLPDWPFCSQISEIWPYFKLVGRTIFNQGKTSPTFSSPTFLVDARFVIKNFRAESANKKDFEGFMITLHWQTPSTPLSCSEILTQIDRLSTV